jgi:hypothetical protein
MLTKRLFAAHYVKKRLVEQQWLDPRREPLEDFADLAGDLGVVVDRGR